jgi:alpha-galactosidase
MKISFCRRLFILIFTVASLSPLHQLEAAEKPLKVFILVGQSNMQGHAQVRTIEAMRLNPTTAPLLSWARNPGGQERTCQQTWISSIGSADEVQTGRLGVGFGAGARGPKIGPEWTFGLKMEESLEQPILIIKTAWGGRSLNTDFRPPSAGDYEFSEQQLTNFQNRGKDIDQVKADKKAATGVAYRLMLDHIQTVLSDIKQVYPGYQTEQGYELSGFVWFQGWNDMVDGSHYPNRYQPGGYDQYATLLAQFIRDVRKDLQAAELPFVIGVMGVGGPTSEYGAEQQRYRDVHQNFRDAMAAPASLPEFEGKVATVLTENYWDHEATDLKRRERALRGQVDKIKAEMKSGEMTNAEGAQAIDAIYAEAFDKREREILTESISNLEFHYLGSAGIMTQIGVGFADAMLSLMRSN